MIIIKGTDEYTYKDIPDTVADKFTVEGGKQPLNYHQYYQMKIRMQLL